MVYSNNFNQVRVGVRNGVVTQVVNAVDADATAFIAAAGITNLTQASAINTLVNDLKTYGLWTKMKALYPMVGGTATSHKFNLKDPRDLDAAYRLVFNGGWVHSSTGALPNGTTAYADTKLTPSSALSINSTHISYYSRTQTTEDSKTEIGCSSGAFELPIMQIYIRRSNSVYSDQYDYTNNRIIAANTDTTGLFLSTRTSNVLHKVYRNSAALGSDTNSSTQSTLPALPMTIAAYNNSSGIVRYSSKEAAFASIGDGLTDTEAANFYTAVQKFQTTLGRQIGSPIVSDTDAQTFINAAGLTDLGQATAINTLVVDLKAAGIWTKMKAIYPFVGGTATTHKWNLKDPRDLDAAFRLQFNGGWTHTSTGALPNGTTGYANTYLNPYVTFGNGQSHLPANSTHSLVHMSKYSRTNSIPTNGFDGVFSDGGNSSKFMYLGWNSSWAPNGFARMNGWGLTVPYSTVTLGNRTDGFFVVNRGGFTSLKSFRNNTPISTDTNDIRSYNEIGLQLNLNPNGVFLIGAGNLSYDLAFRPGDYNSFETSFQSIGDGLTDTESSAFYTAVQRYQTTLGRQIGTPVLASGQTAGLLETYSGAAAAYSLRKLRNGYYGFAIRVRRSSDNLEQDISFKADGTLDTVSLLAFVGNGNGFVTTWYDQSGNGYNAYQSTAINQPLIVSSGSLTTNGGKPAIRCASGTGLLINQISLGTTHSMFAVIDWSGPNKEYFGSFGNSWAFYQVDGEYKANGAVGRTNASFTTNRFLGTLLRVNTQLQYYQNSATLGSAFTISSNNVFNLSNLIGEDYNWGFAGDQQEAIIYTSGMASSRTAIETNINTYYSIY